MLSDLIKKITSGQYFRRRMKDFSTMKYDPAFRVSEEKEDIVPYKNQPDQSKVDHSFNSELMNKD